jgi:ACDE family multidrug resistance protein
VLLAYTPFALVPLGLSDAITLGFIFFGWGISVAITSVWVAPLLTARMPRTRVLWFVLPLLALDLVTLALLVDSAVGLIVGIVIGGLLLGILNTVLTECVMEATDLPRAVASSAYSGVRFLGGAIAPPAAALLAATISPSMPFWAGAVSVLIAAAIVIIGRKHLRLADGHEESQLEEAEVLSLADAT